MAASEADELTGELYLVPPTRFVAARDELVRTARAAGNRELASALRGLRRPTQSAWLVNLLARHEPDAMHQLRALGRELRRAQTQLDAAGLRSLAGQRQRLVAELLDRARRRAADVGLRPSDAVLSEVEATLYAALVDLAASATALSGRLVRPMAHTGFGPMPHVEAAPRIEAPPAGEAPPGEAPPPVETRAVEQGPPRLRAVAEASSPGPDAGPGREPPPRLHAVAGAPAVEPAPRARRDAVHDAEVALAAAESVHWQREHELADAEGAVAAAADRLDWLEQQRMEARRDKVTAERHVAEARAAQRSAVRAVADARRALDAAERAR
jgi:hypothetical protein